MGWEDQVPWGATESSVTGVSLVPSEAARDGPSFLCQSWLSSVLVSLFSLSVPMPSSGSCCWACYRHPLTPQETIPIYGLLPPAEAESSGPVALCSLESVFWACLCWGCWYSFSSSFRHQEWSPCWPDAPEWRVCQDTTGKRGWCAGHCWPWRFPQCIGSWPGKLRPPTLSPDATKKDGENWASCRLCREEMFLKKWMHECFS